MSQATHRDPMEEFANRIVSVLEKGVKPWVRPWDPEKAGGPQAPFNPVTGKRYHGVNVLILGMDLRAFAEGGSLGGSKEGMQGFARFTQGEIGVPIVGAANATAVAGGFELLLGCDVVVASGTAKFGLPEGKRGLFAAGGGVFISTRIPLAVALELTLTGDPIDASRAQSLGLINQVVPAAQVLDAAVALAERIARNGPLGLRATKELVRTASTNLDKARARAAELQPMVFGSEDAKEGATAFIEKRDPVWKGR